VDPAKTGNYEHETISSIYLHDFPPGRPNSPASIINYLEHEEISGAVKTLIRLENSKGKLPRVKSERAETQFRRRASAVPN